MLGERRVTKVELTDSPKSNDESLYRVWYEDVIPDPQGQYYTDYYEYVWAKDELQAYQRVRRSHEEAKHSED